MGDPLGIPHVVDFVCQTIGYAVATSADQNEPQEGWWLFSFLNLFFYISVSLLGLLAWTRGVRTPVVISDRSPSWFYIVLLFAVEFHGS